MKVFVLLISSLILIKSFAQTSDLTIYKTVLQYSKQKHENVFALQDSTESNDLITIEWSISNGKLNVGGFIKDIEDTSWKQLLVEANKTNHEEKKIDSISKLKIVYLSKDILLDTYKKNGS